MAVRIDKGVASGSINMTPMIDCVFLLLIFFLVATRFEEEKRELAEREMPVVLPQASEAVPLVARPKELFVNIDQQGHCFVGGRALTYPQLLEALRQAQADNPGRQTVIIRADKRCVWEYVVEAMNLCNKAQIRDYRVAVLDPEQES
jgi:biopolymer transport protein ExbD